MATPIIPWIGGKRRLARHILPLFPAHTCYVEPFCGAAALYFMKAPTEVEVLNDINGELVNLYRVVQHHLEEFVRQFKWALTSRQVFKWLQAQPPESLTDIQRAARFFYLQKNAFGGKVEGQTFGIAATALRPTVLGHGRLRRRLRAGPVQPSGRTGALDQGLDGGVGQRHSRDARGLHRAANGARGTQLCRRRRRPLKSQIRRIDHPELVSALRSRQFLFLVRNRIGARISHRISAKYRSALHQPSPSG